LRLRGDLGGGGSLPPASRYRSSKHRAAPSGLTSYHVLAFTSITCKDDAPLLDFIAQSIHKAIDKPLLCTHNRNIKSLRKTVPHKQALVHCFRIPKQRYILCLYCIQSKRCIFIIRKYNYSSGNSFKVSSIRVRLHERLERSETNSMGQRVKSIFVLLKLLFCVIP